MFSNIFHHAYLIDRDAEAALPKLEEALKTQLLFDTVGNPDYMIILADHASVDDVKALQSFQEHRPIGERKIVVFGFDRITTEAQNKLLKTLEEPKGATHIFLVTANTHVLLPTVTSRLERLAVEQRVDIADAVAFLALGEAKRLEFIKPFIESRREARILLDEIERVINEHEEVKRSDPEVLETFYKARGYLADRGSSVKNLLEYLAVALPRVKKHTKS